MGKRRGGKRQHKKQKAVDNESTAEDSTFEVSVHPNEEGGEEEQEDGGDPHINYGEKRGKKGQIRRNKEEESPDIADYFNRIKEIIDNKPFHDHEEFQSFVSSTVEEIRNRGLLLLSDRQCSRVIEKLISLLSIFIAQGPAANSNSSSSSSSSSSNDNNNNKKNINTRLECLKVFISLLRHVAAAAAELSIHPNGSHVLQTLLLAVPAVYNFEQQYNNNINKEKEQTIEDFILYIISRLRTNGDDLLYLTKTAAGSHVFRALIRCLGGVSCLLPAAAGKRRGSRHYRKDSEETLQALNPAAAAAAAAAAAGSGNSTGFSVEVYGDIQGVYPVPSSYKIQLQQIAAAAAAAVAAQPLDIPYHVYSSPCLQLLLLILHANKLTDSLEEVLNALLFPNKEKTTSEELIAIADGLVDSPMGSRTLEVSLPLLTPINFQHLFAKWIVKKVNILAASRFGNFLVQKILQSSVFQAAHLKMFIEALDFSVCIEGGTGAVLWRCADACRRLHAQYKEFSRKMFAALNNNNKKNNNNINNNININNNNNNPYIWFCLLMLRPIHKLPQEIINAGNAADAAAAAAAADAAADTAADELTEAEEAEGKKKKKKKKKKDKQEEEQEEEEKEEEEKKEEKTNLLHIREIINPSGCSLLISFLSFPSLFIHELNKTIKLFINKSLSIYVPVYTYPNKKGPPTIDKRPLLEVMGKNKLGSRLLQQIAASSGVCTPPAAVQFFIRKLIPFISSFAIDPVAGYLVTSIYNAANPENKKKIVEELLGIEEEIKEKNYTIYIKCELYKYKQNKEEWAQRQEKRHKARELFKDIISSSVFEEEEEKEEKEEKGTKNLDSLWANDPIAQQLMADSTVGGGEGKRKEEKNKKKENKKRKKKRGGGEEEEEIEEEIHREKTQEEKEAEKQINELFLQAYDEREEQRRAKKKKKTSAAAQEGGASATAAAATAAAAAAAAAEAANKMKEEDPSLDAALFFIEGTNPSLSKRQLAKRKKEEVAKVQAAESFVNKKKAEERKKKKEAKQIKE